MQTNPNQEILNSSGHSPNLKERPMRGSPTCLYNDVTHTDDLYTKQSIYFSFYKWKYCIASYTPKLQGVPYRTILSIQIHQDGVIQLMQQLDYSKAYGPDKIRGCLLKETAIELYLHPWHKFSSVFKKGFMLYSSS